MTEDTAPIIRPIIQTVTGMAASDGAGVRLKRVLGQPRSTQPLDGGTGSGRSACADR